MVIYSSDIEQLFGDKKGVIYNLLDQQYSLNMVFNNVP